MLSSGILKEAAKSPLYYEYSAAPPYCEYSTAEPKLPELPS